MWIAYFILIIAFLAYINDIGGGGWDDGADR